MIQHNGNVSYEHCGCTSCRKRASWDDYSPPTASEPEPPVPPTVLLDGGRDLPDPVRYRYLTTPPEWRSWFVNQAVLSMPRAKFEAWTSEAQGGPGAYLGIRLPGGSFVDSSETVPPDVECLTVAEFASHMMWLRANHKTQREICFAGRRLALRCECEPRKPEPEKLRFPETRHHEQLSQGTIVIESLGGVPMSAAEDPGIDLDAVAPQYGIEGALRGLLLAATSLIDCWFIYDTKRALSVAIETTRRACGLPGQPVSLEPDDVIAWYRALSATLDDRAIRRYLESLERTIAQRELRGA